MDANAQDGSFPPPEAADAIRERGVLLGLGYRLLGSLADAEDVVQETYVRWYRLPEHERAAIASPRAWLIKTAGRIGLDVLGSARARRERYVGEWLPEPVPTPGPWHSQAGSPGTEDPADRVTVDESVSMALLVVLEAMTPAERVSFVLHDVFGYAFPEVAEIVGRSPEACRQLASSARRRVRHDRRRPVAGRDHVAVVRAFRAAWCDGDLGTLIDLLDPDAVAVTDGGGRVSAARDPLHGPEAIARFLLDVLERQPDLTVRDASINGSRGLVAADCDDRTLAVVSLAVTDDGRIDRLWAVRNPEKLDAWRAA
jgi:RNA polymerase sigma factor (sigma-70 family)